MLGGLLDLAGRSDWQSPLYLALAPLAFVRRETRRVAWVLLGYTTYLFATWFLMTHRLERFLLPTLPPLAILAGLGADWSRRRGWTILLGVILAVSLATNLALDSTPLVGPNEWTADLHRLRVTVPAEVDPALAALDTALPEDARVLLVGQASVFPMEHAYAYNSVFNDEILEQLAKGKTPAQIRQALGDRGITHIYVDWQEIERYRSPGNYGFSPFVTPELFALLVRDGVLEPLPSLGPRQELYRVRSFPNG